MPGPPAPVCTGNGTRNGWFTLGANPAGDPATAAPLAGDGPFDQVRCEHCMLVQV